jgi:hypothetical protein
MTTLKDRIQAAMGQMEATLDRQADKGLTVPRTAPSTWRPKPREDYEKRTRNVE